MAEWKAMEIPKIHAGHLGGFPKWGPVWGVPIIEIVVFWGLWWGPPILGNYCLEVSWHAELLHVGISWKVSAVSK